MVNCVYGRPEKTTEKVEEKAVSCEEDLRAPCDVQTSAANKLTTKKKSPKKSVRKKSATKPKAVTKKAVHPKAAPVPKKQAARKPAPKKKQPKGTADFSFETPKPRSGRLSGDLQGISGAEGADSESVGELLEEGNSFEAGAVIGVEEADDADESEVHTHEVPEDDVPEEYLDQD